MNRLYRPLVVIVTAVLAVVLLVALLACSTSSPDEGLQPDPDGTQQIESYTIADSTGDWGYPSPFSHYSRGPGYVRMSFIFETLVWKNATGFAPQLAYEWEYSESDNSYTFKLQEGVKWHDGTDFSAHDVVFTYNYTKEHPYQWVDNTIVESAEAVDEYTVKLHLSRTYAPFFQDVAGTQPILPKHIWQNVTEPDTFTSPEAAIGTGPYKLADYSKEHGTYLFTANDSYYLGQPAANEIRFVKISAEMMPAALQAGSVNCAGVPPEVVEQMETAGLTVISDKPSWNGKLTINHHKAPLSSREFRQAIAYAIDREALVQIVFRGHAVAGSPGMMPPTSPWYNPDTPQYDYSVEKAQQLIGGLGYQLENGYFVNDGQPLKLSLIAAADYKDLGQFVAQQLEEAGIEIEFRTLEAKTVDARVGAWEFDLSIYGHGGLYEPSIYYKVVLDEGFNSARYTSNEVLTQLINDQLTEMDPVTRKEIVFQIQKAYAEDVPALTLYYPKSYMAHDGVISLYYTMDGIASGIPIVLNRMCFVQ